MKYLTANEQVMIDVLLRQRADRLTEPEIDRLHGMLLREQRTDQESRWLLELYVRIAEACAAERLT